MAEVQNPRPTPDPKLNEALASMVAAISGAIGENFVGAYLHGSLAVGGFDVDSDVDLAIAIKEDIAEADLLALQALHAKLADELPSPWAGRIELSYFPMAILRRWTDSPRHPEGAQPRAADWTDPATGVRARAYPLLHLAGGARELARSERDNTRLVRKVLRDKGIVLAGPEPRDLIDEVSPLALRAEERAALQAVAARCLADPGALGSRGQLAATVTQVCRMLHVLSTGEVASKQTAVAWAADAFSLRWNALIRRSLAMRGEPEVIRAAPTARADIQEAQAFIRQVLKQDAPKKPKPKRRSPKPAPKPAPATTTQPPREPRPDIPRPKRPSSKAPGGRDGGPAKPFKDGSGKRPPRGGGSEGAPRGPSSGKRPGPGRPGGRPFSKSPPGKRTPPKR